MGETSPDRNEEKAYLPVAPPPTNHGHTTAAWVTVTVVLVGSSVASIAVMVGLAWLFWVGMGIAVVGLIVGRVLKMLGFGQPSPAAQREQASS